jgi:hypothetical protein
VSDAVEAMEQMIYSEEDIEEDKKKVEEVKAKWTEEEIKAKKKQDLLEKLIILIFQKFFGKVCVILRSTEYDELINRVSHVLIDRETEEVVCFYVEVGEIEGPRFEDRLKEVIERNLKGGARLKYGLKLERGRIIKGPMENTPIFYLALPEKILREVITTLYGEIRTDEKSEYEEGVFSLFLALIENQIRLHSSVGFRPGLFFSQRVHSWLLAAGIRKTEKLLKQLCEAFKKEGFLLNEYCESEMALFEGKFDFEGREKYATEEIKTDIKKVESHLSKLKPEQVMELKVNEPIRSYSIWLLNECLKEDFCVIGSSLYDRIINGVDILLLSKERGDCIAALVVELGERDEGGPIYEERLKKVRERNLQGGAYVKYAFKIVREEGKARIVPSSQNHVPTFYIALPETQIYDAIKIMAIPGGKRGSLKDLPLLQNFLSKLIPDDA